MAKPNKHHPMLCVGCNKRNRWCRLTIAGPTCPNCRKELRRVQAWANEAHRMKPPEKLPKILTRY